MFCINPNQGLIIMGLICNIAGLFLMIKSAESTNESNSKKFYNLHNINENKFKLGFGLIVGGNIIQIVGTCNFFG
jgi:hypothetical protein